MNFHELTQQEQLNVVIDLHQQRDALLIDLAASLEREDELKQQRDELLAALIATEEADTPTKQLDALDMRRAAIAKVKP